MQHSLRFAITFAGIVVFSLAYAYPESAGVLLGNNWKSEARDLKPGEPISLNAILTGPESSELVLKCPTGVLSYKCTGGACKVPACASSAPNVTISRLDKGPLPASSESFSLLSVFKRAPANTVSTVVRGETNPNDAIVILKGDEVHLAPALNRILEGNYCFSLQSLETSDASSALLKLNWNKDDEPEGMVKAPGLKPGVHLLERKILTDSGSCAVDSKSVPAWILLAPETQFRELTDQWKAKRPWFDELTASGSSPAVVATMRHATIAELSQSLSR